MKYEIIELVGYFWNMKERYENNSKKMSGFKEAAALISRDHTRTLIQWNKKQPNTEISIPSLAS